MEQLRQHYGVPAKRGMTIEFLGDPVTILGAVAGHMLLKVKEPSGLTYAIHPVEGVVYPDA